MSEAGDGADAGDHGGRFMAALLAAAGQRQWSALVGLHEPALKVVVLPELGAGVAILERGDGDVASLRGRIDRLLANQGNGVLHLVLAGGLPDDAPVLAAADRDAPDPNRLGVHLLDRAGRLTRVAGRRLALLAQATASGARPLQPTEIDAHNAQVQKRREDAGAFATALDQRSHWGTRLLGAACIVVFALTRYWGREGGFAQALLRTGANSAPLVEDGEFWRLLAHAFLHGDEVHLVVNLIGLFSFGGFLEALLGWRRILVLYVSSAVLGGLFSVLIGDVHLSVGASGAIWGLMAAGVGILLRRTAILPPLIAARMRPRLITVLLVNALFPLVFVVTGGPRIDIWAHFGGGVMGFALAATGLLTRGLAAGESPDDAQANPGWLRALAGLMVLLMVLAVGVAIFTGHPWNPRVDLAPDQFT